MKGSDLRTAEHTTVYQRFSEQAIRTSQTATTLKAPHDITHPTPRETLKARRTRSSATSGT
eukprot:6483418-Amphidinium_carterae.1